jgi:signal transduction histidine kinase
MPLLALDDGRPLSAYGRQVWQAENGLPQNTVRSIQQDAQGYLLLETEGGIVRFDGLKFIPGDTEENTGKPKTSAARTGEVWLKDHEGNLWTGGSSGLRLNRTNFAKHFGTAEGLPSNRVVSLYEDRAHALWVGTDQGLARIRHEKVERFAPNDLLSANIILCIFEDREGNLWLGTESSGLIVLRDETFITYTDRDGLSNDLIRCVFEDSRGVLWIGTNGGLNRFDGKKFAALTAKDGLSSEVILSLAENSEGDLLVGTPDGLNVLHNGKFRVLTSGDGLADDFVRSLYCDRDGSVWIGTRRGVSRWTKSGFQTYSQANGLGSDLVGAMLRDRNGTLWIGTLRGLTRVTTAGLTNLTTRDGLSTDVVTALEGDGDGNLWIGTQDGGLNRLRDGKIFHFVSQLGLPDVIFGIIEDARHHLWLTSKTGIYRVSEKELNDVAEGRASELTIAQYGTAEGLRVIEASEGGHPSAWGRRDGSLWFSTVRGLATIDAARAVRSAAAPPVAIESITIDDKVVGGHGNLTIPPGHERFAFEYAGLSFTSPHKVQFRYLLEGFDRRWIDAGTRRVAYYTNLSPGTYRFLVRARNNDGGWGESTALLEFKLQPHFYQTYWFYALLLVAFGLLCYLFYWLRVKQVQAQFNAVLAERNRIAREIHDTLAQGYVAVSVQLELVGRLMSTSVSAAQEVLTRTQETVRDSLAEARHSIWQLRSHGPDENDFPSRLSKVASQVTSGSGVVAKVQVGGTFRPLDPKVEDELVRIGQEAITNVVRHAQAKTVTVDLIFDARKLRMTIIDDGRGFELAGQSALGLNGHYGLRGMRERAEQIGARFKVTSAPGSGTMVCVETTV